MSPMTEEYNLRAEAVWYALFSGILYILTMGALAAHWWDFVIIFFSGALVFHGISLRLRYRANKLKRGNKREF